MKKKIALLSIITILALSSCSQKTDTTKRSDDPNTNNKTALKLSDVSNGILVKELNEEDTDYVSAKIANNYNDTLFYLTTSITEPLKKYGSLTKSINVSPLTFISNITDDEKAALSNYFYDEEGLYSKDYEISNLDTFSNWESKIDISNILNDFNEEDEYEISVIYIPTYVTHYATSYTALECYVMVPLYYQIYKASNKSEIFDLKSSNLTDILEFDGELLSSENAIATI